MSETILNTSGVEQKREYLLFQALSKFATRRATDSDLQKLDDAWNGVESFPVVYNGELYDLQQDTIQLALGCSDPQMIGIKFVSETTSVVHSPSRLFSAENQFLILPPRLLSLGVQ